MTASYVAGYPTTISLTAKQTAAFAGFPYVKVGAGAGADVIDPALAITQEADGSLAVKVKTSATAKPGFYSGDFTINVCTDRSCKKPLPGAPFKLPYSIEVLPPDGGPDADTRGPLTALDGATDWGTFQANAQHTGYVPVTLNPVAFTPRWRITAPAVNGDPVFLNTVATGGGRVYVTSSNWGYLSKSRASLTAYSETDGAKLWSRSFEGQGEPLANPPAYANGRVFAAAGTRGATAMFGFDAASGSQLFATPMATQWKQYLAPTVFNGNVYTDGGSFGGLYSLNATTGTTNYFIPLNEDESRTPAFDNHNMYTYIAGQLRVQDPLTGAVVATISDPSYSWSVYGTDSAPVVGGGGIVYAGSLNTTLTNAIVAFDTINESVRWSAKGKFASNPAYADGYLFAANNATGKMEVRRESDGGIAWSWTSPESGGAFTSDMLVTRNLVFVSTSTTTYAIDRATHATVWSYRAAGKLGLSANGILYIKALSRIVAINLH